MVFFVFKSKFSKNLYFWLQVVSIFLFISLTFSYNGCGSGCTASGIYIRNVLFGNKNSQPKDDSSTKVEITLPPLSPEIQNKLEPRLREEMVQRNNDQRINVGIWLIESEPTTVISRPDPYKPLPTDYETNYKRQLDSIEEHTSRVQAGLIAELNMLGAPIRFASKVSPLVFTSLTRDEILRVAKRVDVRSVSLEGINGLPE